MSGMPGQKQSLWKSILLIFVLLALMSTVAYALNNPAFLFNPASALITSDPPGALTESEIKTSESESAGESLAGYDKEQINIVLLGFDRSASKTREQSLFRPDSIIIASLNFSTAEVSLLSIPRDSYVKISGSETYDKINHAYRYGYFRAEDDQDHHQVGLSTTLKTIQDLLGGISLHEYVVLDIDGAANIVDTVGGLHYDVEFDVRARLGEGRLLLTKGYQHLDGRQFMDYVRDRANQHGGERGRIERQQKILIALFTKLREEGRLSDIPEIYKAVDQSLETELNAAQVASLAALALRVNLADIRTFTLEGRGQLSYRDGQNIWYWVINEEKRVETIKEAFGVTVEKGPVIRLPGPYYPEPEEESEEDLDQELPGETDETIIDEDGPDSVRDSSDDESIEEENGDTARIPARKSMIDA